MKDHVHRVACLTLCAVFAGLALGGGGCKKKEGKKSRGYLEVVVGALTRAEIEVAKTNMRQLAVQMGLYAMDNIVFPPSLEALVEANDCDERLIATVGREPRAYSYIAGQNRTHPPANVLVYDGKPAYDGKCLVLHVGGNVELLSPEALKEAIEKTKAVLAADAGESGRDAGAGE